MTAASIATDAMAEELCRRARQAEIAAETHKQRVGPVDMACIIRLQQTAIDYRRVARQLEHSRRDNVTLTFGRDGTKCREVFERGDDRVYRVEEELTPEGWRTIGVETIDNLRIE